MKKIFVTILIIITILVVMFVHTYSNPAPGKVAFAKYLKKTKQVEAHLSQVLSGISADNLTNEQINQITRLMEQELMAAKQVDSEWLDEIRSGWGDVFINLHIKGLEKMVSGYRTGNSQQIIEGRELVSQYDSWKRKNKSLAIWVGLKP